MTYRINLACLVAACFLGSQLVGCTDRSTTSEPTTAPAAHVEAAVAEADAAEESPEADDAAEWDADGKAAIEALGERLRAARVPCDDFVFSMFALLADDYDKRFGLRPAAEAMCMTDDEEDLTFYAFHSAAELDRFMAAKQDVLCKKAIEVGVPHFPGYPFIKGDTWFIQPDEQATAERIAPLIGAAAGIAACPGADAAAEALAKAADPDAPIIVVFAEAEPDSGAAPLTVQFSIRDPYNHLIEPTFHWDFGDGNTSDKRSPSHTYTTAGDYTVKLKVADRGGTDEDEVEISVE